MSDIQDLIHKTTMDCLERGRREEQERIIKLLEETIIKGGNHGWSISTIIGILKEEIKGEK